MRRCVLALTLALGCGSAEDDDKAPAVYPDATWQMSTPEAEGFDAAKFQSAMDTLPTPAVVIRHGKIVGHKGDIAASGAIFSASKSLTALIAARLIQQGVLDLDTVVPSSDVPTAPLASYRQFMSMTSDFHLSPHSPGDHYAYNNGAVVHYGDHLQSEYFPGQDPIAMLRSAYLDRIGHEDTLGYTPKISGWGGGWSMSTRDLARVGYSILRKGEWNGEALFPAPLVDALYVDQIPSAATLTPDDSDPFYNEHPSDQYAMADGYSFGFWLPRVATLFGGMTSKTEATSMSGAHGTTVHISKSTDIVIAAVNTSPNDHGEGRVAASSLDLFAEALIDP